MALVVPRVVAVDKVVTTGRRVVVGEAISVVVRSVTPGVEPVQTQTMPRVCIRGLCE